MQSSVERPWLYLVGRSRSSIAHQLQYIGERVSDLHLVSDPIEYKGRVYKDVIRFYSGTVHDNKDEN